MKKMDFVTRLGLAIEKELASRRNEDYTLNPPQIIKYYKVLNYLTAKCRERNGRMEHIPLVPKEEHGYISALFTVFDVNGDSLSTFGDLLKCCSALSIDSLTDSTVCISVTVPNVYVRKDELDRQKAECQANDQRRTIDDEDLLDDEAFLDDDGYCDSEEFRNSWEQLIQNY